MALFDMDGHASAAELGRTSRVDVSWTFTDTTILLQSTGLPFHSYGNPNATRTASAQNYEVQIIYRGGTNEKGSGLDSTGSGVVGFWVNGVAVHSAATAKLMPGTYTPIKGYNYNLNYIGNLSLGYTFHKDLAGGVSVPGPADRNGNPTGQYNYSAFTFGNVWLNAKGDTLGTKGVPDASVATYLSSDLRHDDGHSKIIGWALDGFPIYGPWGYTNAQDSNTPAKKMSSGYILKDVSHRSAVVNNVNIYPMGIFVEDYQWSSIGDLDRHNGRYCVTPDYPQGTYAYFTTVDAQDQPTFPYVVGPTFYGTPTAQTAGPGQNVNLVPADFGEAVSQRANSVAASATRVTNQTNQVPEIITWVTPKGNLGTYKESAELSISLLARSPVVDNVPAAGFDPRLSITSNGNGDFEAIMPSTKHKIAFKYTPGKIGTQEFPDPLGQAQYGSYPNALVPYGVRAIAFETLIPYRGGRNEGAPNPEPAVNDQIGISVVGIPFYGYGGRFVRGEDGALFQVNSVESNGDGRDDFGGYPDRFGQYRYQDSRFINANAWGRISKFSAGYTWPDGHSKIIGWALDGYPIYGPYGYINPRDVGGVQLMVSGYKLKPRPNLDRPVPITAVVTRGTKRTLNVTVNINTGIFPGMVLEGGSWEYGSVWVENVDGYVLTLNSRVTLEANTFLRASWKFGALIQDYEFSSLPGATLDRFNGRFSITPEFPGGTYAYFATQDADGKPVFPYLVGPQFKGELAVQEDPPIPGVADLSGTKTVSGITYTVISGSLPPGTQLYRTTGIIYGHPIVVDAKSIVPRRYDFTVRAQNTRGKIADRAFSVFINNISPPTLNDPLDADTGIADLGTFFDSEKISLQLAYTEANPGAPLNWSVSRGTFPIGLTLTQTGEITGFALAPRAAGAAGTGQYDRGVFDQYVYDFEGATLTKTFKFTVRLYDGVLFTERRYKMTILAKSFFRADNNLLRADADDIRSLEGLVTERTIFRADKDGNVYPTMITDPATIPVIKQDRAFAFKFDAYFPNPNYKIRYEITNSDQALYGEGFDNVGFDSSTLALPGGLSLDTETGWITGTIGIIPGLRRSFDFQIRAWVEVPVSRTETEERYSNAVQFRLQILSAAANLIAFSTPADLGIIDNGRISTLKIEADAEDGQELVYTIKSTMRELIGADPNDQRIVSNVPSRMPQGLKLLPSGRISGRTTFDYFSMDRSKQAEIILDRNSTTVDAIYTFVVEARTLDNTSFQDKTFTLRVRNINKRPYENLYLRSLNSPDLRKLFHSVLEDTNLSGVIYRPDDSWFGIPKTLNFLAIPGLKADTPANYIEAMAASHYNKIVNFGELKTAVALDDNLNPIYEVLYVEVNEPGNPDRRSDSIVRSYRDITDVNTTLTIVSNTFENMRGSMVDDIGYEYQGALPRWMVNLQPDTKRSIGFVRAAVLAYANPGQVARLRVAFLRSLLRGTFGFNSVFNQFSFVADRYEWDRTLSVNYDTGARRHLPSRETTFDISAPLEILNKGPWVAKNTGVSTNLNGITFSNDGGFIAVGTRNTLITSRTGEKWTSVESTVDLTYVAALRDNAAAGSNVLVLYSGFDYRVGDEILQTTTFTSGGRTYITDINYLATISANSTVPVQAANTSAVASGVSNIIPAGTTLEFKDENGFIIDAVLAGTAYPGNVYLNIGDANELIKGLSASIKGLNTVQLTTLQSISPAVREFNITAVNGANLTLSGDITYPVTSGTNISVFETFVADSVTANVSNNSVVLNTATPFVIANRANIQVTEFFYANITTANVANSSIVVNTPTTFAITTDANIKITQLANAANVVYSTVSITVATNRTVIALASAPLAQWGGNANITISNVTYVLSNSAVNSGSVVLPLTTTKSFWGANSSISVANTTVVSVNSNTSSGNILPVTGARSSMAGTASLYLNTNEIALTLGGNTAIVENIYSNIVLANAANATIGLETPITFDVLTSANIKITQTANTANVFYANVTAAQTTGSSLLPLYAPALTEQQFYEFFLANLSSEITSANVANSSVILSTPAAFSIPFGANIKITETANVANVYYASALRRVSASGNVLALSTAFKLDANGNVTTFPLSSTWAGNANVAVTVLRGANLAISNVTYVLSSEPVVTTNVINTNTTVIVNDNLGNVRALTVANVTASNVSVIYTSANIFSPTYANLVADPARFIPTLGGLDGKLQDVVLSVSISEPITNSLQKDTDLTFSVRINAPSAAGETRIYLSNTDRIALGSEVASEPFVATTFPAGGYLANAAATISGVELVIPTVAVQGIIVENMTVLGPAIPPSTTVSSVSARGSLTYINLEFPSTLTGVNSIGSVVTDNPAFSVSLSANLTYPLAAGTELRFDDFTGDPQVIIMDLDVAAGGNVINFANPVGRTVVGSTIKLKGLKNGYATVANAGTVSPDSLYLETGANVEFDIPVGTTLNFQDAQGNVRYVTGATTPTGQSIIEFSDNIIPTLIGTTPTLLGLPPVAHVVSVDTFINTLTLSNVSTYNVPVGSNITLYSVNSGVHYLTLSSELEPGQNLLRLTTQPNVAWVGFGNAALSISGVQTGTVLANTQTNKLYLDLESNASILANTSIGITNGSASQVYTITGAVAAGQTEIPIDATPLQTLAGSNVTIVGLPDGYTVSSRSGNSVVITGTFTATVPQNTYFEFDDGNAHRGNLQLATANPAGSNTLQFLTPPVTPLVGSQVAIPGTGIFSFTSTGLVADGTTVIGKTNEYILLNQPLLANINRGFDESFTYGVSTADYNQVRYVNERWVIVGSRASVVAQDTNGNWQQRFAYQYGDLFAVGYGGGLYVVAGSSGLILTSEDLEAWDVQATNTTATHRGIVYNNGQWYLVSDEGFVQASNDGITWTDITSQVWNTQPRKNLRTIKYINGNWYIVGDGGTVIVSSNNGLTWTVYNAGTTSRINDIIVTAGILIAVGNNGVISESRDGTSWAPVESGINLNLSGVATDGAVALTSGINGLVLGSSGFFVVDFAVRNVSFEMFNNNTVDVLAERGYRVQDGQTCIWTQQEGFSPGEFRGPRFENDGWNNYQNTFDYPTFDSTAFDTKAITTVLVTNPPPGSTSITVTSTQGISLDDYVTVGSYKIAAGIRVTDVYPLENRVVLNQQVIATQGEVISFYDPVGYDTKSYIYGYSEHASDPNITNQRAGIWRCNVSANNIVTMSFVRQIEVGQIVQIKSENTKYFYDQNITGNQSVPGFSILEQEITRPERTTFDGSGTKFSNNRDQYQEPGALAKYIKFPKIGVFE